ncbi:hypothetical protein PMAYCL1PPCAC_31605, partial [Pristionchus mayeri]
LFHLLLESGESNLLDSHVGDGLGLGEGQSDEGLGAHRSLLGAGNGKAVRDLGLEVVAVLVALLEGFVLVHGLSANIGAPFLGVSGGECHSDKSGDEKKT